MWIPIRTFLTPRILKERLTIYYQERKRRIHDQKGDWTKKVFERYQEESWAGQGSSWHSRWKKWTGNFQCQMWNQESHTLHHQSWAFYGKLELLEDDQAQSCWPKDKIIISPIQNIRSKKNFFKDFSKEKMFTLSRLKVGNVKLGSSLLLLEVLEGNIEAIFEENILESKMLIADYKKIRK